MDMENMAVLKSIIPFPLLFWFRGFKFVLNSNILSIIFAYMKLFLRQSFIWGFSFEDRSHYSLSELDLQLYVVFLTLVA